MSGALDTESTRRAAGEGSLGIGQGEDTLATGRGADVTATTLCEAFQQTAAVHAEQIALRTLGDVVSITWAQYAERVTRIAQGLAALGVGNGDTVAIMLVNRPEFNLIDTAALHLGAAPFSIYNTCSPEQITYLFTNAKNRIVATEPQFLAAIRAAGIDSLEHVICLDDAPADAVALAQLEALSAPGFDFEASWRSVGGEDLATICYTSGTTGPPKGVELTHANVLAECRAASAVIEHAPNGRIISYLPHAHMADRYSTHYVSMLYGSQVTALADTRQIAAALGEVRPTSFGSVPRVWEKLKAGLEAAIAAETDPARKHAAESAIETGLRRVRAEQAGEQPSAALLDECTRADELVLGGLRERLGLAATNMLYAGAAPMPVDVLEFFDAIGLPICELWGMSEVTCVGTCNPRARPRIGTVGPALPGIELRIADDGELLCRGPMVMRGYRADPQQTAQTIDPDGWLHTGDIATIDPDGYVRIVDRKKELIINAAGKNMSPANIEAHLKGASPLIGQAIAIGDRRPYNVALIVLDPDGAGVWADEQGLDDASPGTLCQLDELRTEIARAVQQANAHLSRVEQIKRHAVLPCDWLPGGDELTPTMKLKRKPIAAKYAAEIAALYA
ncbi:MAG TPA: AMP-dependent synthetase/ligase [Solirubrobacteraceae bacterium]|nr:AMP-dependent synthetase/ligase [Solirubrobacteraceae bacterium]